MCSKYPSHLQQLIFCVTAAYLLHLLAQNNMPLFRFCTQCQILHFDVEICNHCQYFTTMVLSLPLQNPYQRACAPHTHTDTHRASAVQYNNQTENKHVTVVSALLHYTLPW